MRDPEYLPVMESFYTIQGEGHFTGSPAYFIRLGGCDVGCVWCDVKESWDASQFDWISVSQIVTQAKSSGAPLVVITGGEPFMYDLSTITKTLREQGMLVNVETSGAYPLSGQWDWICFSPKKYKEAKPEFLSEADELKVVVYHKSDFAWAQKYVGNLKPEAKCYLQPEWSKEKEITPLIVQYVKENPKWNISLQTHKYMNIP